MSFVSLWGRERINQFGQWFTFTVLVSVHLAPHLTNIQGSVTVQKRFNYSLDLHIVWCKNNKAQFLTRRITNAPLSMPIYQSNTVLSVTVLVWYINYRCLRKTFRSFAENIRLYHFRRLRSLNNKTKTVYGKHTKQNAVPHYLNMRFTLCLFTLCLAVCRRWPRAFKI